MYATTSPPRSQSLRSAAISPDWQLLVLLEPRLRSLEATARLGGGPRAVRKLRARAGRLCGMLAPEFSFQELRAPAAWAAATEHLEAIAAEADTRPLPIPEGLLIAA